MKIAILISTLLVLQGCSHTLYQSDIKSRNNLGDEQAYRLWWIKTSLFSRQKGSGSMTLDMGCSIKSLTDSAAGIVMKLPADRYTSVDQQSGPELSCATVTNLRAIKDYRQGDVVIQSKCEPKPDDFALTSVTFLKSDEPHVFPIQKSSIKDAAQAPARIDCR